MGMIGSLLSALTQSGPDPSSGVYTPSKLDTALEFFTGGRSLADSAERLREQHYADQMRAYQAQALGQVLQDPNTSDDARRAILFNSGEYGKAMAARLTPQLMSGGQTLVNAPGGGNYTAPLVGFDPASGRGTSVAGDGSLTVSANGAGGGYKSDPGNGLLYSERDASGFSYPTIQKVGMGENAGPIAATPGLPQVRPIGTPAAGPQVPQIGQPAGQPQGAPTFDQFHQAILAQESGNTPGAIGPQTPYGQAQGIGQVLPQTGQAMAAKLGIVWRPDLMTGTSPQATQYQKAISRAYAQEAWQASGGDPAQAARYYYGGPDQKLWGPKTQAYAQAVTGRLGMSGGAQPQAQTSGGLPTTLSGGRERPGTAEEVANLGLPVGTHIVWNGKGGYTVTKQPEYDAAWDKDMQKDFANNEAVKNYLAVVQPSYKALTSQIGKMNGPAAFAMMDTAIRTFNPDAVTRQQQIEAMHKEFGLPYGVLGQLQRYAGNGSIPLALQQQIADAAQRFAVSHYGPVAQLYQSRQQAAHDHGRNIQDITIPVGPAPERYIATPRGGFAESQIRSEAAQRIRQNPSQRGAILAKMAQSGINTQGL